MLLAFDLDGTLLNEKKEITARNMAALQDMKSAGATIALASGRLSSSMMRYAEMFDFDVAMLTLNGAAVYTTKYDLSSPVYSASLPSDYSNFLIEYSSDKNYVMNFYYDGQLYAEKNDRTQKHIDLYVKQTSSVYNFVPSLKEFTDISPSKVIFVGEPEDMTMHQNYFQSLWGQSVYNVRSWTHYLEFLSPQANKGNAIKALADALDIPLSRVAAFGDADNDIPMLKAAGIGIAMKNAWERVKSAADHVSQWTNDEDAIAQEWARIKTTLIAQ